MEKAASSASTNNSTIDGGVPATDYVAPRTERETILANIFAEALKREPGTIGVHDDFWALGGDSQRMMQIVVKAKRMKLDLTLMQIYQCPTVAQLAEVAKDRTSVWKKIFA